MDTPVLPLGDRIKGYEAESEVLLDSEQAIIARVDGRGFSKLTAKLDKPDYRFNQCMMQVASFMVEQTHCALAYTQSDEITLVFEPKSPDTGLFFGGRVQKLTSVLGSMATVAFGKAFNQTFPEMSHTFPMFDCRVFHVPDIGEAANAVLWRVQDASKNAISMVARSNFSTSELHGKTTADRLQMLHDAGVAYDRLPAFFRHGSFWQRQRTQRVLSEAEWMLIPAHARHSVDKMVERSEVQRVSMPGDRITYYDIEPLLLRE